MRADAERAARIRQAMLKQHLEAVAATGRRAETAGDDNAEDELRRWRRRHRRHAPANKLMNVLYTPMGDFERFGVQSQAQGLPTTSRGPSTSLSSRAGTGMAGLLDGTNAPTMVPVANSTTENSGLFSVSDFSHTRLGNTASAGQGGLQGSGPQSVPAAPPSAHMHEAVSFEDEVQELQGGEAAEYKAFHARRGGGAPHRGGGSSATSSRSGKSSRQASQAAPLRPPRTWARVSYRRPHRFNASQRQGLLSTPTQEQLDSMFIQGRTVIAHYCVIPEPPSVVLTLSRSASRTESEGGDSRTPSVASSQASEVQLEVELCEMYPQFDRLNVVANRVMGLNHMAGVFGQGVTASDLRRVRARLCSHLASLFPFLLGHPGDEEGHVTPTAQRRASEASRPGPVVPAACVRHVTPFHSTPLISLFAPPPPRVKLYTTPFKADIKLPSGSQMTLFMPVLGPFDPPYARQATHALRRDAGFGIDHMWGERISHSDLARHVLDVAHAKAERGGRAPSMAPQDLLSRIAGENVPHIPGSVGGEGGDAAASSSLNGALRVLDGVAHGMADLGLGFLGGHSTPAVVLGYWRAKEARIQGQLSQSLLKWTMGIPLGRDAAQGRSGGAASKNGRVTGLELVLPSRPPSAQVKGPLPEYVMTPPAGVPQGSTGFTAAPGTAHNWDTERSGSEHRHSVRGATATEHSTSDGRIMSDMSGVPHSTVSEDGPMQGGNAQSQRSDTEEGAKLLASDTLAAAGRIQEAFRAASSMGKSAAHSSDSDSDEGKNGNASPPASEGSGEDAALGVGVVGGDGFANDEERQAANGVREGLERIAKQLHAIFLGTPEGRPGLTRAVKDDAAISKRALLLATEEFLEWKPEGPPSQWPEEMRDKYAELRPGIVARRDEIYSGLKAEWQVQTFQTLYGDPRVQEALQRIKARRSSDNSHK